MMTASLKSNLFRELSTSWMQASAPVRGQRRSRLVGVWAYNAETGRPVFQWEQSDELAMPLSILADQDR